MPASDKPPVWLLDVDGVINAVTAPGRKPPTHVWPKDQWRDTMAWGSRQRWRIVAAQPVLDFISAAHTGGRAEVRWHTTWQQSALGLGRELGLPEFEVQDAPEFIQGHDAWWKLPAVWRVLAEGRRVLWTDDDAATELKNQQWETLAAAGCHILSPDPYTGLIRRHLKEIDEYLPSETVSEVTQ